MRKEKSIVFALNTTLWEYKVVILYSKISCCWSLYSCIKCFVTLPSNWLSLSKEFIAVIREKVEIWALSNTTPHFLVPPNTTRLIGITSSSTTVLNQVQIMVLDFTCLLPVLSYFCAFEDNFGGDNKGSDDAFNLIYGRRQRQFSLKRPVMGLFLILRVSAYIKHYMHILKFIFRTELFFFLNKQKTQNNKLRKIFEKFFWTDFLATVR